MAALDSLAGAVSTGAFPPAANGAMEKPVGGGVQAVERLILMRHGEAERPAPGLRDFDRALDAEGRTESRNVGTAMAKAGVVPDLALVSAATRTLETWRAVAEAFPSATMEEDPALYAASAVRLASAVAAAALRARTLILVGHNPGIHQYAIHLARQGGAARGAAGVLYERFPTGTAAVFAVGPGGTPSLERMFVAKDYRGKARP